MLGEQVPTRHDPGARSPSPATQLEWVFTLFSLVWLSNALELVTRHATVTGTAAPLARAIVPVVYGVTFVLLVMRRRALLALLPGTWPLLMPVLLAVASGLWSVIPEISPREGLKLAGTTGFGFHLAIRYRLDEQLELIGAALAIGLLASIAVIILRPDIGLMVYHTGAWEGIFQHKNTLARIVALAMVVWLLLGLVARDRRWMWIAGAAALVPVLYQTDSRSGVVVALVSMGTIGVLSLLQRSRRRRVLLGLGAVVVAAGAALVWRAGDLLALVGRDMTLNSRTTLWSILAGDIADRPWLGFGYRGFWRGDVGPSGELPAALYGWYPIHAHNGFVDLALELGLVGLVCFLVPFAVYGARSVGLAIARVSARRLWPCVFVTYLAISNYAESDLLRQNHLNWAIYVATVGVLDRIRREDRRVADRSSFE